MVKLFIKTKGLFINIPGLTPFRTPVEIDITKLNLNTVISELKKNGIIDYKIVSADEININKHIEKKHKIKKDKKQLYSDNLDIIENQKKIIEKIESLENTIFSFIENKSLNKENNIKNIRKKKEIEIDDDFIPSINLDSVKIKGATLKRSNI